MKNFPIPIIVSSGFKEPRTFSGRGPLATGFILFYFFEYFNISFYRPEKALCLLCLSRSPVHLSEQW